MFLINLETLFLIDILENIRILIGVAALFLLITVTSRAIL